MENSIKVGAPCRSTSIHGGAFNPSYSSHGWDSQRAWYNCLESLRDWLLTPLSSPGQNLPCPLPTTIPCFHFLCQTSARRRSPRPSMVDRSVPTAGCSFWLPPTSVLA